MAAVTPSETRKVGSGSGSHLPDTLPLRLALAGVSNCCAATITNPLDVLKVRMQVDAHRVGGIVDRGDAAGLRRTLASMLRDEGVLSLYRGLAPSLLREASYSSLRLGLYEPVRDGYVGALASAGVANSEGGLAVKLLAGGTSGIIGSAVANPADLLKVRIQAQAGARGSLWGMAADIVRRDGVAGLWQGVRPSMARAAVLTASQVGSYDHIKQWLRGCGMPLLAADGLALHVACSLSAGFVASLATTPIDFVKTRLMTGRAGGQPSPPPPSGRARPSSAWACVVHAVRDEGAAALYKGFVPTFMRIGPHTVVTFIVFERLRGACGIRPV